TQAGRTRPADPSAADPTLTGRDPPPARAHPAHRHPRHRPRPALVAVPPAPPNPCPHQPLPPPRRPPTSGTANVVQGTLRDRSLTVMTTWVTGGKSDIWT